MQGTRFIKSEFNFHGGYLTYKGQFVARFKISKAPITKAIFIKELIKNHTVESYFEELKNSTPVHILKEKNLNWYVETMNKFYIKHTGGKVYNEEGKLIKFD